MGVATHHENRMPPAERGDPHVLGRNRRASTLEFQSDGHGVPRGLNSNIKIGASVRHSLKRPFARLAVASVRDTESEIPSYNDGDRNLAKRKEECPESRLVLRFDLFEVLVEDLLYPHGLLVEMGQFARTRYSQRTGGGLGLAKGWVRDLQCGLHDNSSPYRWDSRSSGLVRTRQIREAM